MRPLMEPVFRFIFIGHPVAWFGSVIPGLFLLFQLIEPESLFSSESVLNYWRSRVEELAYRHRSLRYGADIVVCQDIETIRDWVRRAGGNRMAESSGACAFVQGHDDDGIERLLSAEVSGIHWPTYGQERQQHFIGI
ncbi:MAG TPA: hypothetical protein VN420_03420 [Candidatus Fimivivens sp.]|nr:hypothetical protein [Candidatus Fimivivens sp.]